MNHETVTMATDLDDLDLECLKRRLHAATDRLAAVRAPANVQRDFRGIRVSVENLKADLADGRLTLIVGGIGSMWTLTLGMPAPAWWEPTEESVVRDIGTLLSTWKDLIESPRARLSDRIDFRTTGLSTLCTELGAVMLSEGIDPKDAVDVFVRARMPYEPMTPKPGHVPMLRADTRSRTVGVQKQRILSVECEDALLARHRAFKLDVVGTRSFSIDAAPAVTTKATAGDPMDTLRILDALDLKTGAKHVLKAARRPTAA